MKQQLLILFFLLPLIISAQESTPYFEGFNSSNLNDYFLYQNQPDGIRDWKTHIPISNFDPMIFTDRIKSYNNAITNPNNKSIKIKVTDLDTANSNGTSERVEIFKNLDHGINKTYFYSWNMMIPDDGSFEDNNNGSGHNWHIISQFIQGNPNFTECIGDQPVFKLNYVHEPSAPNERRDLVITYGYYSDSDSTWVCPNPDSSCGTYGRKHSFRIEDAIEKGEWFKVIVEFHWNIDNTAYMKIWINHKPVIRLNCDNTLAELGIEGNSATAYYSRNVHLLTSGPDVGQMKNNLFKVGHYRDSDHQDDATLCFDNFRITDELPPKDNKTKLILEYCDKDIYSDNVIIKCYEVPNAVKYKFKFTKPDVGEKIYESSTPFLDLNNVGGTWLNSNTTYSVKVRTLYNQTQGYDYGDPCTITTPRFTSLTEDFCPNRQLSSNNMVIHCYPIIAATKYKFKFTRADRTEKIYESSTPFLDLNNVGGTWLNSNTTYSVKVRTLYNQTQGYDYGDPCTITTPRFTSLTEDFCPNRQLSSNNMVIHCYPIIAATKYKFKFTRADRTEKIYESSTPFLDLNNVGGTWLNSNTTYSVKVRTLYNQTQGYDYKDSCSITTSLLNNTYRNIANNSINDQNDSFQVKLYPNPFKDFLNIKTNKINSVKIYNIKGNRVYEARNLKSKHLNLSHLVNGIYFIKTSDNLGNLNTQIILKKDN